MRAIATVSLAALLLGCPSSEPTLQLVQDDVFSLSCAFSSCHGTQGSGELELTDAETSMDELINVASFEVPGETRVIPGDSGGSMLFKLLEGPVGDAEQMPPSNGTATVSVTAEQLNLVRDWIDQGAL